MSGVQLGSAYGTIEIGTDSAQKSITSLSDTMRSAGTSMSLGITAPLAGIAAMALSSAGDFEQSMNVMAQVSGATADQMATLQAQALEMGAVTSFSAGEAAQAQLELAKAGLSVNDIISATPGVLSMAAAGGMGLAESAEIAANAMNAFNLPASEMPNIANMLAAAANASSVDISDLAAAMKMSGAVFASNKQPMDDMVTALAMLGNAGLKGSDAGTSLKTMMLSLAAPTAKAKGVLADMGVAVYDASGNMRSFETIIADLSVATAGMTDAQRNAALSTVFGSDAIRAATILTRDYSTSWDGIAGALNNGSAAADVANARMKGIGGAVEYLKGSIDSFLIGAALPYLASIGEMIRTGADLITAFGALPKPVMDAAVAFGAVLAAAGPVMLAVTGLSAALGFLLSPIGLVVVGVGALAAAWATNFGGIRDLTAEIAGQVGPALQSMLYPLQQIALAMGDAGVASGEVWEAIKLLPPAIQPVAYGMQNLYVTLTQAAAMLAAFFAPAIQRVQDAFAGLPTALAPIMPKLGELGAAFGGLMTALQPVVMLIGAGLAIAADFGINAFAAVLTNLPGIVGPIIDQVTATLQLVSTVLTAVIAAVRAAIDGDWAGVWAAAQDGVEAFSTYYRGLLSRLGTFTATIAQVLYDAIVNTLKDMGIDIAPVLEGIRKAFEDVWAKVQTYIQPVIDLIATITTKIGEFKDYLGGLDLPNPFAGLASAGQAVMDAIGGIGNAASGGGADGNPSTPQAIGTSYFRGGAAQINERGYEQIVLPAGSRIYTNGQTNNLPASEGKTVNINLGGVTVRSEADARRLGDILRGQLVMAGA